MAIGSVIGINNSKSNNSEELALSSYSRIIGKNETITFTVITSSDDPIYAISSDTNIATTTVNNKTVSATGVAYGNVIITVMQENVSSNIKFLCIISPPIGNTLDATDWETISEISKAGSGYNYWDIGDVKSITLNGNIGDGLTLSNFETNVFILHFNYPMNGIADNNIIWGGFKDSTGKDIALIDYDHNYSSTDGTMHFNMNHWGDNTYYGSNFGGWKGSCLRYDILGATSTAPSQYGSIYTSTNVGYDATSATLTSPKANTLLAALPSNFRNSLRLWSRWIDATGNRSNVEANIKETIDAVTLLAEFEVWGTREHANQYEQNHQSQMEYYRLGNSKVKYAHDDCSTWVDWWLISPYYKDYYCFCTSNIHGNYSLMQYAHTACALAPAFKT